MRYMFVCVPYLSAWSVCTTYTGSLKVRACRLSLVYRYVSSSSSYDIISEIVFGENRTFEMLDRQRRGGFKFQIVVPTVSDLCTRLADGYSGSILQFCMILRFTLCSMCTEVCPYYICSPIANTLAVFNCKHFSNVSLQRFPPNMQNTWDIYSDSWVGNMYDNCCCRIHPTLASVLGALCILIIICLPL